MTLERRIDSAKRKVLRRTLLGCLCLLAACSEPEELPLSGVLITIDTTNAAALDLYGVDRGLTPRLMDMSKECVVFDRAHTVAPMTLPAHVSMMTGLYPIRHGVRENGLMQLTGEAETLAEIASEAGFQTAAFISALVLSGFYGIDQGFDVFNEPPSVPTKGVPGHSKRTAENVTDAAIEWLRGRDEKRPFFLWIHYFDPHHPYDPPAEFIEKAKGNLYRAEVASMDHHIGRLFDELEARVGFDKLTMAIVADHGEAFGAHGEPSHSAFCYQATVHVPMLLRFADGRRAGTRSDEVVSVVDLFPTLLGELGLGPGPESDGLSLAQATVSDDRGVYVESYSGFLNYGWSPLAGWIDGRGKYLHSSKQEYYDLESDPGELTNLAPSGNVELERYTRALENIARLPRLASKSDVELSDDQIRQLRALGYAAAGDGGVALPDPLDPSERPAPVDRAEQYAKFVKGLGLAQSGRNKAAIKLLREVVAENPGNLYALETLGGALLADTRVEEAVEVFESLLTRGPDRYLTRISLGTAYENLGELQKGLEQYEVADRLQPGNPGLAKALERIKKKIAAE